MIIALEQCYSSALSPGVSFASLNAAVVSILMLARLFLCIYILLLRLICIHLCMELE
jgi:hypothetical protein